MTEFEDRLGNYYMRLKNSNSLIQTIIKDKDEEKMRVFLYPKDEKELTTAEVILDFAEDFTDLLTRCITGQVENVPVENNPAIEFIIQVIKASRNNEQIKTIDQSDEEEAKLLYDIFVIMLSEKSREEAVYYIADKAGFNLDNDKEAELLMYYIEKAKTLAPEGPSIDNLENAEMEKLEKTKRFVKAFHKCCEEGKKETDEMDLGPLLKLLMELGQ